MDEAQAVVERQPAVHLPVVLEIPLDVVVEEVALDELRVLRIRREHPRRGIGEAECGVERVVGVVREAERSLPGIAGLVLRLVAVIQVEARLRGVPAHHLGRTDRNILRAIDVQEPGEDDIGRGIVRRRIRDSRAPGKRRWNDNPAVLVIRWVDAAQNTILVVIGIHEAGVRIDLRQRPETGVEPVGDVVDHE